MNHSTLKWACGLLLIVNIQRSFGQQGFDLAHSNHAGYSGVAWNPATLAANRYAVQLQLASVEAHAANSAYRYSGPWLPWHQQEGLQLTPTNLDPVNDGRTKLFDVSLQIRGPSVLVNIGKQGGIAFSVRTRQAFQGNTIAPSLLKTSIGGLTSPANWSGATFNLNATALSEWNGSYGRVLLEKGAHQLKVGVTVKHLFGIGAAYLQGRDVNYEVLSSPAGGDSLLLVHDFQGAYGVANADAFRELDLLKTIGWLTGRNASGYGWGADVGVAYEYRPSSPIAEAGAPLPSDKSYRFRVGAALVDLGSVYYDKSSRSYPSIELHEAHVSQDDASNFYPTNFDNKLSDIMRLRRLSAQPSLRTGLPTVLNLDLDYHMRRSLYLNAAVSQGLRGHYAIGMRSFSYASLTPRLETRGLEVAVPLYMMNDYRNFATGFTLRFRSLRVGTNNVMGFFSKTNPYGMSCYVEGSLLEFEKGKSSKRGRHSKRRQVLTPP